MTNEGSSGVADATLREFASGQKLLGRYTPIKILGRGGMGIVWLARDEELEREVALKFFPDLIIRDSAALSELKLETKRCLELTHSHIVRVYDFVHDERSGCISMEYIDGETLASLRCQKAQKVFEPTELSVWVGQLCDALHYAHNRRGIIHRDLKPANLMVNRRGNLKVSDFGIARSLGDSLSRLTMEQQGRSGTLIYMSPQQLNGERGTPLDDIYSLGATLYELLTSKPPFYSGNIDRQVHERVAPSMTERRKEFDIEPTLLPPVWEETVAACLAKDPGRRPQSVREIAEKLQVPSPEARPPVVRPFFQPPKNRVLALALGLLCLLALALGGWYFGVFKPTRAKVGAVVPVSTVTAIPEKSIAVLPFENLSRDPDNAYFADGVQEEILTRLSKIADLKVISRTSTAHYASAPGDLRQIASQLDVANILEGSVQKAGDSVRVNVQLINALNDAHLWADTYDRKLIDIFAVESDIAKTIADTLQAKLTGAERKAITTRPTENTEAHQLYLQGRFFWNKRTGEAMMKSIDYFTRAIEKDSAYALAYAGLADAYVLLPNYSKTAWKQAYPKAKAAAMKALELDDNVAEAHISLANLRLWNDWGQNAEEEFKRGIELSPSYATGHHWYSIYLSAMGRHQEAIAEMTKAQELDPLSLIIDTELGLPYLYAQQYDQAITQFQEAIEMDPSFAFAHFALAEAYDRKGRFEEALAEHDKSIALAGEPSQAWLSMTGLLKDTYRKLGGKDYWQKRLEATRKQYDEHTVTAKAVAEIYAILGNKEQALGWLEKSYQEHDRFLVFLKVQSEFDILRGDPRFEALVAKVFAPKNASSP